MHSVFKVNELSHHVAILPFILYNKTNEIWCYTISIFCDYLK